MAKYRFDDPRDEYVQSPDPITTKQLAHLYLGRAGCSESRLAERCAVEGWVAQREEFQAKLQQKSDEKAIEVMAKKRAKTLEELNTEAYKRCDLLMRAHEASLKRTLKEDPKTGESYFDIGMRDLSMITRNMIQLHHEMRLHCNFDPDKPVQEKDDNSADTTVLDALFSRILGPAEPPKLEGSTDA